jgi:hypothetical protein
MAGASAETHFFAPNGLGSGTLRIYFQLDSSTSTTTAFATGALPASTVSLNGGAFNATANSVTEIGTTGVYFLVLNAAEYTADITLVKIKTSGGTAIADKLIRLTSTVQVGAILFSSGTSQPCISFGPPAGQPTIKESIGGTLGILLTGTASAGSATTITFDPNRIATDNYYNECQVYLSAGTGKFQSRTIIGYVGATGVATLNRAWTTTPDSTSQYTVRPGGDVWDQLDGAQPTGPSTGANLTFRRDIQVLRRRFYNKVTQTVSTQTVFQDDNATPMTLLSVSDDGTVQVKGQST